ncbi:MAG TPA: hypothetical protein VN711_00120 [Candidatus Saccharimonadales bacterium]|nr:hypothetical protein [Candidatus Saccharimonadales bacterium]
MLWLRKNSVLIFLIILVALCIPAVTALFHAGFFLTDDGNWMIIRLSAFYEALRNGQVPPRFLLQLNHGYGYPVADFLYPLFMYIGIPIHILGLTFADSIKTILGGSIILSGIFTLFWLKKLVKIESALVGAFLYVFAPYHLWDVYHRGSVGEVLAIGVVPFILWQIERKNILWVAVGIALLILAHNSLAVLFLPFIIGYIVIRKSFSWKYLVGIVAYALSLSAFFWIPALYDKQFTIFDKTPVSLISDYFLTYNTSLLVGWIGVLTIVLTFPLLLKKLPTPLKYFWLVAMMTLFLTLPISSWVWSISHIAPYFQFPYRFLSLTILVFAGLAAFCVDILPKKIHILGIILFVAVGYLSSWSLLTPLVYQNYPDTFYSTNQDSTTVHNEYTPIWVKSQPTSSPENQVELIKGNGTILDTVAKGNKVIFNTILTTPSLVQINVVYFPGWNVFVDGKKTDFSYDNTYGVMQVGILSGQHTVQAVFSETPVRIFADVVTVVSILLLPIFYRKLKKYETA